MPDFARLVRQLLSPDASAKIARSVIRPHPLFAGLTWQLRIRRLRYGAGQTVMVFGADGGIGVQVLGPGNVSTRLNPGGLMSPVQAAAEIVNNLEYSARKPTFQFLGVGGRRIAW